MQCDEMVIPSKYLISLLFTVSSILNPPPRITGTWQIFLTSLINSLSNPLLVPSLSTELRLFLQRYNPAFF